jgi:hypothetical protein
MSTKGARAARGAGAHKRAPMKALGCVLLAVTSGPATDAGGGGEVACMQVPLSNARPLQAKLFHLAGWSVRPPRPHLRAQLGRGANQRHPPQINPATPPEK